MQLLAIVSCALLYRRVFAADCPSGNFCAWTEGNFEGQRFNWAGDDPWWDAVISQDDSSWANHGASGPGIKDHVQIFSGANQDGDMTLCLAPGQEVSGNNAASDRGYSHVWARSCEPGDY